MNRESRARAVTFRVGVFILAALAALIGMVYLLGARARLFEARFTIHAEFTEVGGLADGATVRLAGVQIGRVTAVNLPGQPGGKARIDMSIAKKFGDRVRQDSVARIETQGLLGDKIVEITVGTANAPPIAPGAVLAARDPTDIGQVLTEGAATVRNVAALTDGLRTMTESLNKSNIVEDTAATVATARRTTDQAAPIVDQAARIVDQVARIVDQIEQGRGWAHVLLYEEPVALKQLDAVIASTRQVLDRVERGEGAAGVLTSKESAAAARRLLAAMDRLGTLGERRGDEEGLLPALLFDPKYRGLLEDLRSVAKNLRDVSDRVAGGRGTLGSLVKDEPDDGGMRTAAKDLRAALANLKAITEKLNEGEGTLGALIADATLYERLVSILEGAQRSFLLRGLLRGLGSGDGERGGKGPTDGKERDRRSEDRK